METCLLVWDRAPPSRPWPRPAASWPSKDKALPTCRVPDPPTATLCLGLGLGLGLCLCLGLGQSLHPLDIAALALAPTMVASAARSSPWRLQGRQAAILLRFLPSPPLALARTRARRTPSPAPLPLSPTLPRAPAHTAFLSSSSSASVSSGALPCSGPLFFLSKSCQT